MKAIVYTQHGMPIEDPQSLHEQTLPEPAPGPRDLRVKVRAIAVNPVDMKVTLPLESVPYNRVTN